MADKKKAKKKKAKKKKGKKKAKKSTKMTLVKKSGKKPKNPPETPAEKIQLLQDKLNLSGNNLVIATQEATKWQNAAKKEAGLKQVFIDEVAFLKDTIRSLNAKFTGDKKP